MYGTTQDACDASTEQIVNPVVGNPPRTAHAEADLFTRHKPFEPRFFTDWEEWVEFSVQPGAPPAAAGPTVVRVTGGGESREMYLPDQLAENPRWYSDNRGTRTWTLNSSGEFEPKPSFRGKSRFRYTVRFGSQTLDSGSFVVEHEDAFGNRIWEGTDAFVNVCINGNHRLHSLHHRLYCWAYYYPATNRIRGL